MNRSLLTIVFVVAAGAVHADEPVLRSGLAVGDFAAPFDVKDCTGPAAGKTLCYYCQYADRPVVSIFVRRLDEDVATLIKSVDDSVVAKRDRRLAAFVVYLAENKASAVAELKDLGAKRSVVRTPLTLYADSRAKLASDYRIADEAEVTVMLWRGGRVRASHAFGKQPIAGAAVERVLADIQAMVP